MCDFGIDKIICACAYLYGLLFAWQRNEKNSNKMHSLQWNARRSGLMFTLQLRMNEQKAISFNSKKMRLCIAYGAASLSTPIYLFENQPKAKIATTTGLESTVCNSNRDRHSDDWRCHHFSHTHFSTPAKWKTLRIACDVNRNLKISQPHSLLNCKCVDHFVDIFCCQISVLARAYYVPARANKINEIQKWARVGRRQERETRLKFPYHISNQMKFGHRKKGKLEPKNELNAQFLFQWRKKWPCFMDFANFCDSQSDKLLKTTTTTTMLLFASVFLENFFADFQRSDIILIELIQCLYRF